MRQIGGGPSSQRDHTSFQKEVNAKFVEIEAKLTDKANKTTVAQALHRKANKPELDAVLAKKVDFEDLQRILDNKVDIGSFQNLVRTVDYKADKHEILQHNLTMQHQNQTVTSQEASLDKAELERLYNTLKLSMEEADARMSAQESQLNDLRNQATSSIDKLSTQLNLQMQGKTEYNDLEQLSHKLHAKADFDKV